MSEITCPHPAYGRRDDGDDVERRGIAVCQADGQHYIVCFTCSMVVSIPAAAATKLDSLQTSEDPRTLALLREETRALLNEYGVYAELNA